MLGPVYTMDHELGLWKMTFFYGGFMWLLDINLIEQKLH